MKNLIAGLLLLKLSFVNAQCFSFPPGLAVANDCESTTIYCDPSVFNVVSCTPSTILHDDTCQPPQFCGATPENSIWYGFVAPDSNPISFEFVLLYCTSGFGIDLAIYSECYCDGGIEIACEANVISTATLTISNPIPGEDYFILVDGNAGSQCDYEIIVSHSGASFELPCDTEIESFICSDLNSLTYSADSYCLAEGGTEIFIESSDKQPGTEYSFNIIPPTAQSYYDRNDGYEFSFIADELGTWQVCLETIIHHCDDVTDCGTFPKCIEFEIIDLESIDFGNIQTCYSEIAVNGAIPFSSLDVWRGPLLSLSLLDVNNCYTHIETNLCGCQYNQTVCYDLLDAEDPVPFHAYVCDVDESWCFESPAAIICSKPEKLIDQLNYIDRFTDNGCHTAVNLTIARMELDYKIDTLVNECHQMVLGLDSIKAIPEDGHYSFMWFDEANQLISEAPQITIENDQLLNLELTYSHYNEFDELFECTQFQQLDMVLCNTPCPIDYQESYPGAAYTELGGDTVDEFTFDVSNCISFSLSSAISFSQDWTGQNSSMDDCTSCGNNCACDPGTGDMGSCDGCWDFMHIQTFADGVIIDELLIGGEDPLVNLKDQDYILNNINPGWSQLEVKIHNQNWDTDETNSFGDLSLVCYDITPVEILVDSICTLDSLELRAEVQSINCFQSWKWSSNMGAVISDPNNFRATAYQITEGEIFIFEATTITGLEIRDTVQIFQDECSYCVCDFLVDTNVICSTVYNPVCGCDNVTYQNACVAQNHYGLREWFDGECGSAVEEASYVSCDDGDDETKDDIVTSACICQGDSDVVLALEAIALHVSQVGQAALIEWQIDDLRDVLHYEIQHAEDGVEFESIFTQTHNESESQYKYLHEGLTGLHYYRIKAIMTSGKQLYSNIQSLQIDTDSKAIAVYPNPTNSEITIELQSDYSEYDKLTIYNSLGAKIMERFLLGTAPKSMMSLQDLKQGLYFFKFKIGEEIVVRQVLKM